MKKLNLSDLKVESFVTTSTGIDSNTVKGGTNTDPRLCIITTPATIPNCPTSPIICLFTGPSIKIACITPTPSEGCPYSAANTHC